MHVITWSGEYVTYATFRTEAAAVRTYKAMTEFMGSIMNLLEFELGVDGKPDWDMREYRGEPVVIAAEKAMDGMVKIAEEEASAPVVESIDEIKLLLDDTYMSHREMWRNMLRRVFTRRKGDSG